MKKKIGIYGVPMNLGQPRDGVELGSTAIRATNLHSKLSELNLEFKDFGDAKIPARYEIMSEKEDFFIPTISKNLSEVSNTSYNIVKDGYFPVFLGGDHAISIGTISGVKRALNKKVGVIWIDAHADFNTIESSPSGNVHGMPLAVLTGLGDSRLTKITQDALINKEDIVIIGARDLDISERKLLKENNIKIFSMEDIDDLGLKDIMLKTLDYLKDCDVIHVSFDMDALDPSIAPGVGTPVLGGLTLRDGFYIAEKLCASNKLCSVDLVENNPLIDIKNQTANIAREIILTMLGKTLKV